MKITNLKYFLVAVGIVSVAWAQAPAASAGSTTVQKGHGGHNSAAMESEILAKLNLSPTQKTQVKAAFKTMANSVRELRKSEKGTAVSPQDLKEKIKAIRKTYKDSLKTILSPSQLIQLKAIRKELREKAEAAKAAGSTPTKA